MRVSPLVALAILFLPAMVAPVSTAVAPREGLIVSLTTWPPPAAAVEALDALGARVMDRFDVARALLVSAPHGSTPAIRDLPFVASAAPDERPQALLTSSKLAAGLVPELVQRGLDGRGIGIALVDSGIDSEHPALSDRVVLDLSVTADGVREGSPSTSQHGTHVAGILVGTGAETPGGEDLRGIAPAADLVSLDLSSQFTTSNALRAFEWIFEHHDEHNIRVVSNSWGRQREPAVYDPDDALIRASDALVARGIVVVFSSGNGGEVPGRMTLEATNPNIITVGAATDSGRVEPYSSRGPILDGDLPAAWTKPDLVAPGSRIVSTRSAGTPGAWYVMMNGTSMAAPHVAGAAALILGVRPDLTPGQIKGLLVGSARDVGPSGPDPESGSGMLDVARAVELLGATEPRVEAHRDVVTRGRTLTGPPEAAPVLSAASLASRDSFAFTVPPNATRVDGWVNWTGQGRARATFADPSGQAVEVAIDSSRRVTLIDPTPGLWQVTIEPVGIGTGEHATRIAIEWLEVQGGVELPDTSTQARSGAFPFIGARGPFDPSFIPGVPTIVPFAAGALFTVLMIVRRRRS